jgi:serine/threonine protein kinase
LFSAAKKTMNYCPKCQRSYENEAQRFCLSDGARLVPAPNSEKSKSKTSGVFTNIIGRPTPIGKDEDKLASITRFVKTETAPSPMPNFTPSDEDSRVDESSRVKNDEVELELAPVSIVGDAAGLELELDDFEPNQVFTKPARVVNPNEIPSGTAEARDPKTNPTGRTAFSRENPNVLLGQTIKGRYLLTDLLGVDETSVSYLAEDKINPPKKASVRVLTDENHDELTGALFAEERVSLSHINHPNIARVFDSGELPEGMPFIVSEFIEAGSVRDLIKKSGQINALRTARIIRQAAYALSEIHQSSILHRDLKPENILLPVSESGAEQVVLTDFGASSGKLYSGNLSYKAPEILEGKTATFAGDIYSLAVIAYQMLINRLPFQGASEKELLKAHQHGLMLLPTSIRFDVPPAVDKILEKALAFDVSDRYPKARDFGDAFFNAVTTAPESTENEEVFQQERTNLLAADDMPVEIPMPSSPLILPESKITPFDFANFEQNQTEPLNSDAEQAETIEDGAVLNSAATLITDVPGIQKKSETTDTNVIKSQKDLWTRRSPEPPVKASRSWLLFSLLGLAILLGGIWAAWNYSLKQQNETEFAAQTQNAEQNQQNQQNQQNVQPLVTNPSASNSPQSENIEVPPLPRQISQPPDTIYFQNSKQNLKGDLLRNYIPFSLYYPKDWEVNAVMEGGKNGTRGKFLDISKNAPNGMLSEQMLISYYDSEGIYKNDSEKFPQLVKETNETLKKLIPNYQVLSEGETVINGWKGYEVKFQGGGTTANGEKLIVWGRRLFIPAVRAGLKSGYELTLLATSFSTEVKSVDDVGTKGELATVLETFEPNQNF